MGCVPIKETILPIDMGGRTYSVYAPGDPRPGGGRGGLLAIELLSEAEAEAVSEALRKAWLGGGDD